ncbi:hypothetical protein AU476_04450 [Cupriavidus sp. UYMSc13B]|nr:hypothetical protein AU476_04450 [Cupriavidus sp. UYMSc13B]
MRGLLKIWQDSLGPDPVGLGPFAAAVGVSIGIASIRPANVNQRRYAVGWLLTALVVAVDWVWLSAGGYSVPEGFVSSFAEPAAVFLLLAGFLAGIGRIHRYAPVTERLRIREMSDVLRWVVLLACFIVSCNMLQYLCVTVAAPLIDEKLLRLDRALGFDWLDFYRWVRSNTMLQLVLKVAYLSFFLQLLAVPIILGLTRHRGELSEFVLLIMISEILLLFVSTPAPASSTFVYFGITDPDTSKQFPIFIFCEMVRCRSSIQCRVWYPFLHFTRWLPLSAHMRYGG